MRAGIFRQQSGQARIGGNLDLLAHRNKSGATVKTQCRRMIEGAGMHMKSVYRLRPGDLYGLVHKKPSGARSEERRRYTKKGQFAFSLSAEVKFKQGLCLSVPREGVEMDIGVAENFIQFHVRQTQA